jgi:hypothetical protein
MLSLNESPPVLAHSWLGCHLPSRSNSHVALTWRVRLLERPGDTRQGGHGRTARAAASAAARSFSVIGFPRSGFAVCLRGD